ncbi:ataxin-2 amine-terminal region family protein (macronuclear) [Tetrahymena thermophila SB210]|uniref:Ataxin-2 amine-terminal region family protein n=1 Tax=Tetrahymena thermophila (strain SB210) TaxID=312017 RepID=Q23QL4_TETTS|nr:ataxin-2 amine-terminal region family protein [Tetrahymena thermophila SB210]EAR98874.2 ataxin-2 amine-terminal region family protein [Tetrahymena thermophila SB210]|eukprot:XP_001019119.2 ataxin-2 amine-terminal region family protein [Tetrahymena thermophila SB210]
MEQQKDQLMKQNFNNSNILMINSTSIGIYKMKPPSLIRANKPNSMIQLRYLKQTNVQNQNQINSFAHLQNGKDYNNISNIVGDQHQQQQKLKWEKSSQINAQNNFRISASSQKQSKSKSVNNLPASQQINSSHSFVGRNSNIQSKNKFHSNKKDLQSMMGVTFEASHGLENLCENALFKKQVDELKFSSDTPQKLISSLKSEIKQQSKLEFSHCYSQDQSNSFYNSENGDQITPQRQRNFSHTHQDFKKSIYSKELTQTKQNPTHQKLNKSEIALPLNKPSESKVFQVQPKLSQENRRTNSRRRLLLSQQETRKKAVDAITDVSFQTQEFQSRTEANTNTQNQFKEILGNKNINVEKRAHNKINSTLNQSIEQGISHYNQNKMAAMISRDNSNIVNQSLQLLNTLRKKSQNMIEDKSPVNIKPKSQQKFSSQLSTQNQTRQPSQHQENRNMKNVSQFSIKHFQNACDSAQDQNNQQSEINIDQSQMDQSDFQITKYKQIFSSQTKLNPSKQLLVNQFLKEKTINSKDWPKLREKIYYTLCQKGYNNNNQNLEENVQNNSTASKQLLDEIKQNYRSQKQIRNSNQIQQIQQNILSSFLDSKDVNDSQSQIAASYQTQTKNNAILSSTKNTLNLQSQISFKQQNGHGKESTKMENSQINNENNLYFNSVNHQMRTQNKNQGQLTMNINNSPITSFNDQLNQVCVNQIKSLDTTPTNKKQLSQQTFNQFSSSQQMSTNSQLKTNTKFKLDLTKLNNEAQNNKQSVNDFNNAKAYSARIISQNEILHQSSQNTQRQNIQIKSARINNNQDNTNNPINSSYFKGATQLTVDNNKSIKQVQNEATPQGNKVKKSISFLSSGKPNSSSNKVSFQQKVNTYNQMNFINHVDNLSQNSPSHSQNQNNDKQVSFMNTTSKSQFQKKHSVMNSLCLIQLKKIKQKVTDDEKLQFQNFFQDIIKTQNMLKYQKDTPIEQIAPEYKLHQIKYIPRGNKELFENKNLTSLYRREIKDYNPDDIQKPSALQMESVEKEEYENYKKLMKVQQEYNEDKYYIHSKEQNLRKELTSLIEQKQKENERLQTFVKFEIGNVISPNTQKKFEMSIKNDSKWSRIKKEMIEFLQKVQKLNLTMDEVVENKLFTQVAYSRVGSQELFNFIKANDYDSVYELLKNDKYLVYTFDKGMNTPLQIACKRGFSKIAQKLIEYNSDLDHINQVKKTALYYSCCRGDVTTALLLLKNKANPWSNGKCSLNEFIYQFGEKKDQINAAKRIHFIMNLLPFSKKQKLWDEFQYIFKN